MKKALKEIERATKEKITTLILAGFGLVAALAWNDAIQSFFNYLFPKGQGIVGKFVYALIITLVVVIISVQLQRIAKKKDE